MALSHKLLASLPPLPLYFRVAISSLHHLCKRYGSLLSLLLLVPPGLLLPCFFQSHCDPSEWWALCLSDVTGSAVRLRGALMRQLGLRHVHGCKACEFHHCRCGGRGWSHGHLNTGGAGSQAPLPLLPSYLQPWALVQFGGHSHVHHLPHWYWVLCTCGPCCHNQRARIAGTIFAVPLVLPALCVFSLPTFQMYRVIQHPVLLGRSTFVELWMFTDCRLKWGNKVSFSFCHGSEIILFNKAFKNRLLFQMLSST